MYAMFDVCLDSPEVAMMARVALLSSDGGTREASGRIWPASWNRVAVDIAGLALVSDDVVGVEVGIRP